MLKSGGVNYWENNLWACGQIQANQIKWGYVQIDDVNLHEGSGYFIGLIYFQTGPSSSQVLSFKFTLFRKSVWKL